MEHPNISQSKIRTMTGATPISGNHHLAKFHRSFCSCEKNMTKALQRLQRAVVGCSWESAEKEDRPTAAGQIRQLIGVN